MTTNSFLSRVSFFCLLTVQICTSAVLNEISRFWIPDIGFPGAEDIAVDTDNNRIFTADGATVAVNALLYTPSDDLSSVTITLEESISFDTAFIEATPYRNLTLIDVTSAYYSSKGLVVAALIVEDYAVDYGWLGFIDSTTLSVVHVLEIESCYLPDDLCISSDGNTIIVACEGEPDNNELEFPTYNPPGTVAIVDISADYVADWSYDIVNFEAWNDDSILDDLYITHKTEPFSINAEPEFSVLSDDEMYAYVALQEVAAIAVLDITAKEIIGIYPLGHNDFSVYGLDASNKDGGINIQTYPNLYGMRAPDVIDYLFSDAGRHYIFTANEGDSKDFDEVRVKDVILSNVTFADYNVTDLQLPQNLGRLKVSNLYGQNDDGDYEELYAFSSRDFTIWEVIYDGGKPERMDFVYSSDNIFETVTAEVLGVDGFNSNYYNPSADDRSDDKGPEPETIKVGTCANGRKYVFISMERVGGIFVFDITGIDDGEIEYIEYYHSRNFSVVFEKDTRPPEEAGDTGPEAMRWVDESVYGAPLLIVAYPESSSVAIYRIDCEAFPTTTGIDTLVTDVEAISTTGLDDGADDDGAYSVYRRISFFISMFIICVIR